MERGLFRCHQCNAKFPGEFDVQAHIISEHKKNLDQIEEEEGIGDLMEMGLFRCHLCNAKFLGESDVQAHIISEHKENLDLSEKEANFMCSFCEEKFVTEDETRGHVGAVHANMESRNGRFAATAQLAALLPSQNRRRLLTVSTTDYNDEAAGEQSEEGLRRRMPTQDGWKTMWMLRQFSRPEADLEVEEANKIELAEELAELRNEPVALAEKKRRRRELLAEMEKLGVNAVTELGKKRISSWSRRLHDARATISEFALWKSTLRRVEGRYGTAVYSFFKFMKWAMGLNLFMSAILSLIYVPGMIYDRKNETCPIDGILDEHNISWYPEELSVECCTAKYQQKMDESVHTFGRQAQDKYGIDEFADDLGDFLGDIFLGTGWFQYSALFYGFYSPITLINDSLSISYQMPLAYFLAMFSCFLVSLFLIVRSSSQSFHSSFKWNQHNSTQYFVLVFCSWDFCLDSKESADVKQGVIVNEMKTALETDAQQDKDNSRTRSQRFVLYMKRILIRTLILCGFVGFGVIIIDLTNTWVPDWKTSQECAAQTLDSFTDEFVSPCFWLDYATSLVITCLNMLLPYIFSYIIIFEEWAPGTALTIDLLQCMIVRLASLFVIMLTLYQSASCPVQTKHYNDLDLDISYIPLNISMIVQSCDNTWADDSPCAEISWDYCWETFVGVQFYQLAFLDLVIQIAMILFVDLPRSRFLTCLPAVSNIEFNITKHVLDIVYSQTITWMALFFSPLITLINVVKLFFLFFIRIFYVQYICKPTSIFFQASKASSIFKYCLLFSVLVTICILGIFVCEVPPSISCGAFKGQSNYFDVVTKVIADWDLNFFRDVLFTVGTEPPLLFIAAILAMIVYIYATRAVAFGAYNDRMETELSSVASEKRLLMATIQQRMAEKTFNKLFNKGESIIRK